MVHHAQLRPLQAALALMALALIGAGCGAADPGTTSDTEAEPHTGAGAATASVPGADAYVVDLPAGAPEDLLDLAIEAWQDEFDAGTDLSSGPCLGVITPGWVADIAHDPRTAADDERANQCDAFHDGTAPNFVELAPSGIVLNLNGIPVERR